MKIVAHCLVHNEERFIWYAIHSILQQVDEIIVWDTGSTDNTVKVIESLSNPKILFAQKGKADSERITKLRQEMLDQTNSDWVLILDGDEIWWYETITKSIEEADDAQVIVSPVKMLVGDMYHYLPDSKGKYQILGKKGHYNIRLFKRDIQGLHVDGDYPWETYRDLANTPIQNLASHKISFASYPYLHASHLVRSKHNKHKVKYEFGESLPLDYFYPEVFFTKEDSSQESIWQTVDFNYKMKSLVSFPLKKIKNLLLK